MPGATLSAVSGNPARLTALIGDNGLILLEPLAGTTSADEAISVTIRATQNGASTALGSLNVRILPRVAAVTLTPTTATMTVGQSQQVSAAVSYVPGGIVSPAALVEWRSDNIVVATVSEGLVRAERAGETTIRAFAEGVPAYAPVVIRVVSPAPTIAVTPQTATILPNATVALSAVVTNGQEPVAINFTSRDPDIATVSASGLVTGITNGTVDVEASYTLGGTTVRASARITVATPVADMVLDPLELSVPAGYQRAVPGAPARCEWPRDVAGPRFPRDLCGRNVCYRRRDRRRQRERTHHGQDRRLHPGERLLRTEQRGHTAV